MENITDINKMRRIRNMEKGIKLMEEQLKDLKAATKLLQKHVEYRFFSIACHEMVAKQKEIARDLLQLRVRLDKYKNGGLE